MCWSESGIYCIFWTKRQRKKEGKEKGKKRKKKRKEEGGRKEKS